MPRIPIRTEPYTSPARQQRHYKSKRDRALKALCTASFINGSQFAVIFVNAKGDVDTYASELFTPKLADWFHEGVQAEARGIVMHHKATKASEQRLVEVELAEGDGEVYRVSSDLLLGGLSPVPSVGSPSSPTKPSVGIALADEIFKQRGLEDVETPCSTDTLVSTAGGSTIGTSVLDEWFCNKFHMLQQNTCKLVAKCWIKVIEPKKQNKYPYQEGDKSMPPWWPAHIRHKEPDHLHKHERSTLLLAILTSGRAPITRLQLSTAEVSAHITPDKIAILREIYEMAKEQEARRNDPNYKPRLSLILPVLQRDPSPTPEEIYSVPPAPTSANPRKRPIDENFSEPEPRRQTRRLKREPSSSSEHLHRSDSLPGPSQPPRPRRPQHGITASQPASMPPQAPFTFSMPPLIPHDAFIPPSDMPMPQQWSPAGPHFVPPMFAFPPFPHDPTQFGGPPHLHPAFGEDFNPNNGPMFPCDQFGNVPPPSPNSVAMMMWGAFPPPNHPQDQAVEDLPSNLPSPSYPTPFGSLPESSWADLQHFVESQTESTQSVSQPVTPPRKATSPISLGSVSEDSMEAGNGETSWLLV